MYRILTGIGIAILLILILLILIAPILIGIIFAIYASMYFGVTGIFWWFIIIFTTFLLWFLLGVLFKNP